MTTICANKSCMAADSKVTCGDTSYNGTKLYRVGRAIVGAAGRTDDIEKFMRWYRKKGRGEPPRFSRKSKLAVLVLTPKGLFHASSDCALDEITNPYFAIGSGDVAALVAMDLGCDPSAAIEAACKRDAHTGGPVQVLSLEG